MTGARAAATSTEGSNETSDQASGEAVFEELRATVEAEVMRRRLPGVALGLLCAGQTYTAGFGVTNIDHPLTVDADTLFQVGSITKTFAATAAMRLVEEGQLDLDQPVQTYLPDLKLADPAVAATVTSRHLLTHTGGWVGDYFSDTGRGDDALARYVWELADLEQLTPPGQVYSYSNSGFSLLGRVIEVLTGETFEGALRRLVLNPLGLENSFLFPEEVMTRRFAVGHAGIREGQPRVLEPWHLPRSATPAGGLVSSVHDQLRYAAYHMGDGTTASGDRVLTSASLARMREPLVPSTGPPNRSVGLAWNVTSNNISHGGGTYGQSTFLMLCPSDGIALSILTNAATGDEIIAAAIRWVSQRLLGANPAPAPVMAMSREALDGCAGLYQGTTRDIEVGRLGEALVMREIAKGGFPTKETPPLPEQIPLRRMGFYAPDRLVGLDPPIQEVRAEVLRNADGSVEWLRYGGRIRRRMA